MKNTPHIPVLADEVLSLLAPKLGERYFDGTAGYGGHAGMVHEQMGPTGRLILTDQDDAAITALESRFGDIEGVTIWHMDFLSAAERLQEEDVRPNTILLDLGVSSPQLDQPERGFSFRFDGPLDMRMDTRLEVTAADIVNGWSEQGLADLIYQYGEERKSRRIARAIVAARPLSTTAELAECIKKTVHSREEIHPATRTFQALRIEVNQELDQLTKALPLLCEQLAEDGRIAVISFHSLEDRIVKSYFKQESVDCICPPEQPVCTCDHVASLKILTKRPAKGTIDAINPRARSAKLRAACKLKTKIKETL